MIRKPRKTILLVEDSDDLRQILQVQLSARYSVIVCSCACDALEKLNENHDVSSVVTDINLGFGMTGWSLIRRIKENEAYNIERFVVVSGDLDAPDIGWLCNIPVFVKGRFKNEELLTALD